MLFHTLAKWPLRGAATGRGNIHDTAPGVDLDDDVDAMFAGPLDGLDANTLQLDNMGLCHSVDRGLIELARNPSGDTRQGCGRDTTLAGLVAPNASERESEPRAEAQDSSLVSASWHSAASWHRAL